jgi:hypothetical protein
MSQLLNANPTDYAESFNQSYANRFTLSGGVTIDGVAFWRHLGNAPFPTDVYLYDRGLPGLVYAVATPTINWVSVGGGWWTVSDAGGTFTPQTLGAGEYTISASFETLGSRVGMIVVPPNPDSPANVDGGFFEAGNDANPVDPIDEGVYPALSVFWNGDPDPSGYGDPTDPAGTATGEQQDLAAWLQFGNPSLRPDSLPSLNNAAISGNTDRLDALLERLDTDYPIVLGSIGSFSRLAPFLAALGVKVLEGVDLAAIIQALIGPADGTVEDTMFASLRAIQAQMQVNTDRFSTFPGDEGWSLMNTDTFEGPFFAGPAFDVLRVTASTFGESRRFNTYGGLQYFTQPVWWVPFTSSGHTGPYQTFMGVWSDLYQPYRRSFGGYVHMPPDVGGTWEAWRFLGN